MSSFIDELEHYPPSKLDDLLHSVSEQDVRRALASVRDITLRDFAALISPVAKPYLKELVAESVRRTVRRFGRTIQLFVPLYISNECQNICTYCGFSFSNRIPRKTLTATELEREVRVVKQEGFQHVLLLTGEAQYRVGPEVILKAVQQVQAQVSQVSLEVQPLEEEEYRMLQQSGVHAVYVYQETYHREEYRRYHPKGKKSNFEWRLETPERLGRAGLHKIGIGALIGLADWRRDAWYTALHLAYLRKHFWRTKFSLSFPRLRPAEGVEVSGPYMHDAELLQLIAAFRLFDERLELTLSTREPAKLRDVLIPSGITTMSAGSRTEPGGYAHPGESLEQFAVSDERPPAVVAQAIQAAGYDVVWKDWEGEFGRSDKVSEAAAEKRQPQTVSV